MAVLLITFAFAQIPPDDAELAKLAKVDVTPARMERKRQIVHAADYHFVPRNAYAADLRSLEPDITEADIEADYKEHLATVKKVQAEQRALLEYLISRHDVKAVHQEGLTDRDRIAFAFMVASLRRSNNRDSVQRLRIGAAGQLVVAGKLKAVLPAEDTTAFEAANPVDGESVEIDENAMQRRRLAIVRRLERHSFAVVVLGDAHDLSKLVDDQTELVRLTVPTLRDLREAE